MSKDPAISAYKREFTTRIRRAREARGWKQQEMADFLDIRQDKYKQYERRSFMPHYLLPKFCKLCAIDLLWLFTGHGHGPPEVHMLGKLKQATGRRAKRPSA